MQHSEFLGFGGNRCASEVAKLPGIPAGITGLRLPILFLTDPPRQGV